MASDILSLVIGYLFGSIPTAYLLVHWKHRIDIRATGSGNVGALNTYQVTGSRVLGLLVMTIDAAKGVAAVLITAQFGGFRPPALAGIAAVLGHTASVWIGLKGGRGLATAAGVLGVLSWPVLLLWGVLWAVARKLFGNIHVANIAASILAGIAVLAWPAVLCQPLLPLTGSVQERGALCVGVIAAILFGHRALVRELWQSIHTSTKAK